MSWLGRLAIYLLVSTCLHSEESCFGKINNNQKKNENSGDTNSNTCQRIVCFFSNLASLREMPVDQYPSDVNASHCTHIIYASAMLKGNKQAEPEWINDQDYRELVDKKESNPSLKILLSLSGQEFGADSFTKMVRTRKNRKFFIDSSIKILQKYNFDGLDLNWQYPAHKDSPPKDKQRFSSLLRELRHEFNNEHTRSNSSVLLLTAAVAAKKSIVEKAYEVGKLNKYLDFINLMSYDFHDYSDGKAEHHSPLYPRAPGDELNVQFAAMYWLNQGMSKHKIVVGVPLFGRTFNLESRSNVDAGAPTNTKNPKGIAGPYTLTDGFMAYYECCELLLKTSASRKVISSQHAPYYVVANNMWVGYDDPKSVTEKVKFVLAQGFGGVMVQNLGLDDMRGEFCEQGKYPMMTTINNVCRAGLPTN